MNSRLAPVFWSWAGPPSGLRPRGDADPFQSRSGICSVRLSRNHLAPLEDLEFALRLAKDLKKAGASVWMDKLDIRPGQLWERKVEEALRTCPRMLVILSPSSVNSRNVMAEVSFAMDQVSPPARFQSNTFQSCQKACPGYAAAIGQELRFRLRFAQKPLENQSSKIRMKSAHDSLSPGS